MEREFYFNPTSLRATVKGVCTCPNCHQQVFLELPSEATYRTEAEFWKLEAEKWRRAFYSVLDTTSPLPPLKPN